jgi:hypothetical protein
MGLKAASVSWVRVHAAQTAILDDVCRAPFAVSVVACVVAAVGSTRI